MPAQRWRLYVSRGSNGPDLPPRELVAAWDTAIERAGVVAATSNEPPKVVLGAPMPAGLTADREPLDLFLPQRRTAWQLRDGLAEAAPTGFALKGLHDVWLGEPALPGQIVAADYCVDLVRDDNRAALDVADERAVDAAVAAFLRATTISRVRTRNDRPATGNLRALVHDIRPIAGARLWMRLRFDPTLGTGRPEEVTAALGVLAGIPLVATTRHRERVWLKGELPA